MQFLLESKIVNWTNQYNREITKKQLELQEKNKVKKYIKENPVNENNISEVSDYDLEINLYNFFKNKENIPEYYFHELEKRFKSKNYINNNKWTLFILAFSKNESLIKIFNKYFKAYNMQNYFVKYFNESDFISKELNINFEKFKNNEIKYCNNKSIKGKKTVNHKYFLNNWGKKLFNPKNWLTKKEAFNILIDFIINSQENFLK